VHLDSPDAEAIELCNGFQILSDFKGMPSWILRFTSRRIHGADHWPEKAQTDDQEAGCCKQLQKFCWNQARHGTTCKCTNQTRQD
jgi:hypothetical protein